MILPKETPERDVLERIAEDLRGRGYQVLVQPSAEQGPPFLADLTPDLIASRGAENLVIEVKNDPRSVDHEQLHSISSLLASQPGWRLVLMAPPPKDQLLPGEKLRVISEEDVRRRIDEAELLQKSGHHEAALLVAWSAIEASLRFLSEREGIATDRPDTGRLLRTLASEGILQRETFQKLNDWFRFRSAIAHGFQRVGEDTVVATGRVLRDARAVSDALLSELRKSA